MSEDQKIENGLDGGGDESHLAQLLLAGRMGRRRKLAGLALARKILEAEEEGEEGGEDVVEDEDEEGGEEHKLARLILAGGLARRRRRRRLAALA